MRKSIGFLDHNCLPALSGPFEYTVEIDDQEIQRMVYKALQSKTRGATR